MGFPRFNRAGSLVVLSAYCVLYASVASAQSERLLLQIAAGISEADGLLSIPFVSETGGLTSAPRGADNGDSMVAVSLGYRVAGGLYVDVGFSRLGDFDADREVSRLRPTAKIDEWSLAARYLHPLNRRMSAMWRLGVTRANIDTDILTIDARFASGALRIFETEPIPDETGVTWGTGLYWTIGDRMDIGFAYHSHELDRTDVASIAISMQIHLLP